MKKFTLIWIWVLGYNIVDCNNMIVIAFILAVYKYYYEA